MTSDQSANRTQGETEGVEQEPTQAGDSDATQREQEAREGQAPTTDPSQPQEANERMARQPDAVYGQSEAQADGGAGTGSAGMTPAEHKGENEK